MPSGKHVEQLGSNAVSISKLSLHDLSELVGRRNHTLMAIMGASQLEQPLRTMVETGLPGLNSSLRKKLFDGYSAPFGSFATKIDMAHAMGRLGAETAEILHLVREIRNKFAHATSDDEFDFEHETIVALVRRFPGVNGDTSTVDEYVRVVNETEAKLKTLTEP